MGGVPGGTKGGGLKLFSGGVKNFGEKILGQKIFKPPLGLVKFSDPSPGGSRGRKMVKNIENLKYLENDGESSKKSTA